MLYHKRCSHYTNSDCKKKDPPSIGPEMSRFLSGYHFVFLKKNYYLKKGLRYVNAIWYTYCYSGLPDN